MKSIVLFDSDREVTLDEIREQCESNEMEVPEQGSEAWYSLVNDFHQWDWEDFRSDAGLHFDLGLCLVTGYDGLWDGRHEGGKVLTISNGGDLVSMLSNCDQVVVSLEPDDGLVVTGHHHDGTNRRVVRQLNKRGVQVVECCGDERTREYHARLKKLSHRVTKKMIGL